jgi:DNA polymerase-1
MTIHLIDASGLIHRAFHAIRPLKTSKGLPTNALFGLVQMLRKFVKGQRPDRVAVVFDAGRETFRNAMYDQYKANRPPSDPDLVMQFPYARRICEAMGFPVLEVPGYEADDVIATLCELAGTAGMEVVVESGDKDLLQLVGPGVTARDPMRDKVYDRDGVIGRLGVPPEGVRDFLALVGDASDNVPGVEGIGEKGACELVNAFGTLEGVYANLDGLTPRKRDALVAGRASAFLSRDLATLRKDVPLPAGENDPATLTMRLPDLDGVVSLLKELEFRQMLAEVMAERGGGPPDLFASVPDLPQVEVSASAVLSVRAVVAGADLSWDETLSRVAASTRPGIAALFGARDPVSPDVKGLAIAVSDAEALVIRPAEAPAGFMADLAAALRERSAGTAASKEMHQVFAAAGGDPGLPGFDPVLASYLLNAERDSHSLDTLVLERLSTVLPPISDVSPQALALRAAAARLVRAPMEGLLAGSGLQRLNLDVEIPLARVLAEMERTGIAVDRAGLSRLSADLAVDLQRLEKQILDAAGMVFNPNSPRQLADVLFGKLQLPVIKKTKTGPSTDVTVLEELSSRHPVPALILEYRSLAKLKGTYADALGNLIHARTGRIHTSYNQAVASTGRLSSSDPNLQNIPIRTEAGRKIRAAFVSGEGLEFVSADYSQIELRVLAHLSGDESLVDAFRSGLDIHARTAARIFHCDEAVVTPDQRRTAKVVNFGLLYGMGAFRLGRDLKIPQSQAQHIIDDYFGAFPSVRRYLDSTLELARTQGHVQTAFGRRRSIEGIAAANRNERAGAERMALNMPIQGTAADIIKIAMVRMRDRLLADGLPARLVLSVHDELVLETREGTGQEVAAVLREVMEGAWQMSVPLSVEVGRGHVWSKLHG